MKNITLQKGAKTALVLLFFVSMFNYLDRYVLAILQEAIKEEMQLTDTQLGWIQTAFTYSYVFLAIPFARLADRYSRKGTISVAVGIWSFMTALCGLAQGFWQLAVARVMVGVGEAGATPPAHSMIADYFPSKYRAKALAIYSIGTPIGLMIGFIAAGWIAENYGWRVAFLSLGIPGLLLAIAFYFGVKEPVRGASDSHIVDDALEVPPLGQTIKTLINIPAYRYITLGTAMYVVLYLAALSWLPSYFSRTFDISGSQLGLVLAMSLGLSQLIGMLSSGVITDKFVKRSARWYGLIPAIAMLVSTPLFFIIFGTSHPVISSIAIFFAFLIGIFQGPATFAAIQYLAPLLSAERLGLFLRGG